MGTKQNRFEQVLARQKQQNRHRTLSQAHGIDLTSNDYLGMRTHPELRETAIAALHDNIAFGSGGSRLLRGHSSIFESLETTAARIFQTERSLYFANGYMANSALFQALPSRRDTIIYDALVHASMREGIANSAAQSVKFKHNDMGDLERALISAQGKRGADSIIWIAVESLYSMDGDLAPLDTITNLADRYDAYVIIDRAHDTGIATHHYAGDHIITLHTCGKAVGVAGGLVCASAVMVETLINTARPFIYSTAPPPLQALLSEKSLNILYSAEGDEKRAQLETRIAIMKANSHIMPIMIGDDADALHAAKMLQNKGYDIRAIRPPTVPKGSARLRVSLSVNISEDNLKELLKILSALKL